jgi:hypothetical protein
MRHLQYHTGNTGSTSNYKLRLITEEIWGLEKHHSYRKVCGIRMRGIDVLCGYISHISAIRGRLPQTLL